MDLKIFDVEHGACALLSCDDGTHMMIDCGHNGETGWRPGTDLKRKGITELDLLAITNYDEDHVSGLPNLRENVEIKRLWRNKSVTPEILCDLKTEDGMGSGIEELVSMASAYRFNTLPAFEPPGVERQAFHLQYPEFDDENNLSFVIYLKINGVGFLFPGDLETEGWEELLAREEEFRTAVANTSVLIASHHGRENGIYPELFSYYKCKPYWVVISDKGYQYDTQETVPFYASRAKGAEFRGEQRKVLTTRCDGLIQFKFSGSSWWAE